MDFSLDKEFINICVSCLDKIDPNCLINMMSNCEEDSTLVNIDLLDYCFGLQFPKVRITAEIATGPFMCTCCVDKLKDMCVFKNQIQESYTRLVHISQSLPEVKLEPNILDDDGLCGYSEDDFYSNIKEEDVIPPMLEKALRKRKKKQKKKEMCMIETSEMDSIPKAENGHRQKFSYPVVCHLCGKISYNRSQYQGHNLTHDGVVQCEICKRYVKKISIRNHHRILHNGDLVYACTQCPMRFKYFHVRQKHLFDAHNIMQKVYECKFCNASFPTSSRRALHVRKHHLKHRPFACTECNSAFFEKKDLTSHMLCHSGEKNFECTVCEKKFSRKKTLVEHMKIHLNIKKFKCDICLKAFTQKCTLVGHMKTHDRD